MRQQLARQALAVAQSQPMDHQIQRAGASAAEAVAIQLVAAARQSPAGSAPPVPPYAARARCIDSRSTDRPRPARPHRCRGRRAGHADDRVGGHVEPVLPALPHRRHPADARRRQTDRSAPAAAPRAVRRTRSWIRRRLQAPGVRRATAAVRRWPVPPPVHRPPAAPRSHSPDSAASSRGSAGSRSAGASDQADSSGPLRSAAVPATLAMLMPACTMRTLSRA